jgi:hypothetical protein
LKELKFHYFVNFEVGLKAFLEVNPNLKSLSIQSYSLNFVNELSNADKITFLKRLELLHIVVNMNKDFENIKKLCSICTNLEGIHIELGKVFQNSQELIDSKLVPIISGLKCLKTLEFDIIVEDKNLNLAKFHNIETLILKTQDKVILNLDFIKCKKLKKVVFNSNNSNINTKEYMRDSG